MTAIDTINRLVREFSKLATRNFTLLQFKGS